VLNALFRRFIHAGTQRGLNGDGWQWLALAGAFWLARRVRRRPGSLVARLPLSVGDRYTVTLHDGSSPTARGR